MRAEVAYRKFNSLDFPLRTSATSALSGKSAFAVVSTGLAANMMRFTYGKIRDAMCRNFPARKSSSSACRATTA